MGLAIDIAITHIRSRLRQTLVGVLGVATGVAFSVMMASLMEGSQRDFIAQLVDSLPHITVSDERRTPPRQPAALIYDEVEISNLSTADRRRGIKNPLAVMAEIESWAPAKVAPSVRVNILVRQAGRDVGAVMLGIDPKREAEVSNIASKMVEGSLDNLLKASNAILLGARLAERLGIRVGNTVSISSSGGKTMTATAVGIFRTGVAQVDDSQIYALTRSAQILAGQTGLINELRLKANDALSARELAARIEAETGYKAVSWQEAHEDLLNAFNIRNFIMYTVVGAILLVASFGTYNIISTITHEKTRDIAILKSLGLRSSLVQRIFVLEALVIGLIGLIAGFLLGFLMTKGLGAVEFKSPFGDATRLPVIYSPLHYGLAGVIALGASLIAAWLPARKAASVNPVEIIRGAS
ncbi:MAG: ABC transporter permease [Methylobacterium sp.]|nr:ABC transporter permease [Methylobacterium sp.]MCA3604493.1 ABC transporter permease [Methylobacterium sp.]MCA3616117.1 ABC transporter permease [Methylobacterium sp.]MCA4910430.1 ABC transporter permease [Methylobacterium sp.]